VTAEDASYQIDMYSFYKYDDIGIKKSKDGLIKCYCSNIVSTKEIFDSETNIKDWNTGKAKEVRTDKLLGLASVWGFGLIILIFAL